MKVGSVISFIVTMSIAFTGNAQPVVAVSPEHRICKQDADCQLVEVPCTCGQTKLPVSARYAKNYERPANCTKAEVSHCATAGASLPQAAVCKAGLCAVVVRVPALAN